MRKKLRTLTVLAFLVCCFLVIRDMDIQPTEAPVSGAALVESMLEEKAGKTAESLAIDRTKEEIELPERYDYREEEQECSGPGSRTARYLLGLCGPDRVGDGTDAGKAI